MFLYVIKEIMQEKKIDIDILNKITKIEKRYLLEIENDNIEFIEPEKLIKIAKALDVKIEDLYYTVYDYENIRRKMENALEEEGMNGIQFRKYNLILDKIHNLMLKTDYKINKFVGYSKENIKEIKTNADLD